MDHLILTHGAGSNAEAPLLVAFDAAFTALGCSVRRCNLPYRQRRPQGPPMAGDAARDRAGLREILLAISKGPQDRVFLGGHSYGGRQSTMLASEEPDLADGLLLLSYPLHPPKRPTELRTAHFPTLRTPALFIHGARDPFGSPEEMREALRLIPARNELVVIAGVGHDLNPRASVAPAIEAFQRFFPC
jgi:predicted alpha/beta-hydrolase family hydrolase